MENTIRPMMFIPPVVVTPAGTVLEPAWISLLRVVMFTVPL